ncbi:MAG: outer membrane protein [Labilithrix sp.]|nr:outer membrane protein [Labilithrix sp.]
MLRPRLVVPLVLATLVLPLASAAQEEAPAARAMSLEDAIAYARDHQPEVRAALSRVAAEVASADIPRAQWMPTVGATAQIFAMTANNSTGTYVSTGAGFDLPRIGGTRSVAGGSWEPRASTLVAAGVRQEVFDFGRIAAQAAAADARADVEKQRAKGVVLEMTYDVEEAYYAVLAARAVLRAAEDAFERARVHRDLARAGVTSGLRSPIETTRAEADLARFDTRRMRARGNVAIAQGVFAATVGVPDAALDAVGAPRTPADAPALERAIRETTSRDPGLLEAMARLRAQEESTRAIGAALRPDVYVSGTISGRAGGWPASGNGALPEGDGFLPAVPNWDVGLVLSWPIFDGVVRARRDASRVAEAARKDELAVVRHDLAGRVRGAYVTFDVARRALPSLQRSVEAARANYAQADARFRGGLGTSVELADAEALRTDAEIQAALGQFQLARSRAELGRTIAEGL